VQSLSKIAHLADYCAEAVGNRARNHQAGAGGAVLADIHDATTRGGYNMKRNRLSWRTT